MEPHQQPDLFAELRLTWTVTIWQYDASDPEGRRTLVVREGHFTSELAALDALHRWSRSPALDRVLNASPPGTRPGNAIDAGK